MTWTEKTQQAETWAGASQQAEAWSDASEQAESWASTAAESLPRVFTSRVFSSAVVSGLRVFATGASSGLWDARTEQPEIWTAA